MKPASIAVRIFNNNNNNNNNNTGNIYFILFVFSCTKVQLCQPT